MLALFNGRNATEVARELVRPGFTDQVDVVQALEDRLYDEDIDPRAVAEASARITAQEWSRRESELAAAAGPGGPGRQRAARG